MQGSGWTAQSKPSPVLQLSGAKKAFMKGYLGFLKEQQWHGRGLAILIAFVITFRTWVAFVSVYKSKALQSLMTMELLLGSLKE